MLLTITLISQRVHGSLSKRVTHPSCSVNVHSYVPSALLLFARDLESTRKKREKLVKKGSSHRNRVRERGREGESFSLIFRQVCQFDCCLVEIVIETRTRARQWINVSRK